MMDKLKPVVAFSKAHKFELICGGVALVVLVGLYFYLPGVTEDLKTQALERISKKSTIEKILKTSPNVEGVVYPGGDLKTITATEQLTRLKESANGLMLSSKEKILRMALEKNTVGRVRSSGNKQYEPYFGALILEREDNIAPGHRYMGTGTAAVGDTNPFLDKYYKLVFDKLTTRLTGTTIATAGVVPTYAKLELKYKEDKAAKLAGQSALLKGPTGSAGQEALAKEARERDDFIRNEITSIANGTMMYVDPDASLQHRAMVLAANVGVRKMPTPSEVFEAYVDTWLQWDVVESIYAVNMKTRGSSLESGVAKSAIKRLVSVVVGPGALAPFTATSSDAPAVSAAGVFVRPIIELGPDGKPLTPGTYGADLSASLTGRVEDLEYHVVPMCITIVCEPSAIGKFIENLYLKNNGYTVLARKDTTVDPYAAAASGYLYGDSQCIQVELLVECTMLRTWLDPIMPQKYTPGGATGPGGGVGP